MAGVHDKFVTLATKLIGKNGRAAFIRRDIGSTELVPGQPWKGVVPSVEDTAVTALFLDDDEKDKLLLIPGAPDQRTGLPDQTTSVLIASEGLGFKITIAHKLVDDGEVWEIKRVKELKPGTSSILFELEVSL